VLDVVEHDEVVAGLRDALGAQWGLERGTRHQALPSDAGLLLDDDDVDGVALAGHMLAHPDEVTL